MILLPQHRHNTSRLGGSSVNARWDSLVMGYKVDEDSDGSAPVSRLDVLGTHDLTDTNTVPSMTGLINNAADFTAANSEYLIRDASMVSAGPITVSLWWEVTGSYIAFEGLFYLGDGTGYADSQLAAYFFNNALYVSHKSAEGVSREKSISVAGLSNGWHHAIAWVDSSMIAHVAVDNGTPADGATTGGTSRSTTRAIIGAMRTTQYYANRGLDEFYVFDSADGADSSWRAGMHNSGAGVAYPD